MISDVDWIQIAPHDFEKREKVNLEMTEDLMAEGTPAEDAVELKSMLL